MQIKLQKWLNQAIDQNIGVIRLPNGDEYLYEPKSLGLFSHKLRLRSYLVMITEHAWLDYLVFGLILVDSVS